MGKEKDLKAAKNHKQSKSTNHLFEDLQKCGPNIIKLSNNGVSPIMSIYKYNNMSPEARDKMLELMEDFTNEND